MPRHLVHLYGESTSAGDARLGLNSLIAEGTGSGREGVTHKVIARAGERVSSERFVWHLAPAAISEDRTSRIITLHDPSH